MAKKKFVIDSSNIRRKPPIHISLTVFLLLKVFNAEQWVWGFVCCFVFLLWLSWGSDIVKHDQIDVDIFKSETDEANKKQNG